MKLDYEDIHLLDYWRVLVRRRHIAIAFFAALVGIVAVYSFASAPVYRGTAQLLIDLEKNPTMTFTESESVYSQVKDSDEYYQTQIEILKSRTFADRVVRKLQLNTNSYFVEKKNNLNNSIPFRLKEKLKGMFSKRAKPFNPFSGVSGQPELDPDLSDMVLENMEVETGKQGNILRINYHSENPNVAAAMANGIAAAYIEHNMDIRIKPFRDAVEWLTARMVELRARVEESEKTLQTYKEKRGIESFETRDSVVTQKLQELVTQVVQAEARRQEAEIRYNQIRSVIDNPELLTTVPDIMNNLVIQGLRNEELKLKRDVSELSEKYGQKHPQMVKAKSELAMVQKNLLEEARKMLNAAKTDFEIAGSREASLRRGLEEQKQEVLDLSRKAIDFRVIAGEAESNKLFYELLLKKLQEASLSSGINLSNAQVFDSAVIPEKPVKPRKMLNIFFAAAAGCFGGILLALFVEYMDDSLKTSEDVKRVLDLPFLGLIPSSSKGGSLFMLSDKSSMIAEAYRSVRTSVMLSSIEKPPRVVLITSTIPNEGKTTFSANIAIAMAQMGEKVLLVDVDMRQQKLYEAFSIDNTTGISDVIMGHTRVSDAVRTIPDLPNLSILTGGVQVPNPSELLSSNLMKELLADLSKRYDRIILDSPPLMAVSDSLLLSGISDGVILVIGGGTTGRDMVRKAKQSLISVNAKILGVVLNNISITDMSQYSYYYSGYYSSGNTKGSSKPV